MPHPTTGKRVWVLRSPHTASSTLTSADTPPAVSVEDLERSLAPEELASQHASAAAELRLSELGIMMDVDLVQARQWLERMGRWKRSRMELAAYTKLYVTHPQTLSTAQSDPLRVARLARLLSAQVAGLQELEEKIEV
jgi:hypothetical protein